MQIRPCREAFTAGFEGSDEAGGLEIDALMDQIQLHNGNTETKLRARQQVTSALW